MTIPQRRFGDPLQVLLREEAETCRGCRYAKDDGEVVRCQNPRVLDVLAEKRCDQYEERP